jgi:hypothetical protein
LTDITPATDAKGRWFADNEGGREAKRKATIMDLWEEHGGGVFGPHVETVSMPLSNFHDFITATREQAVRECAEKAGELINEYEDYDLSDEVQTHLLSLIDRSAKT